MWRWVLSADVGCVGVCAREFVHLSKVAKARSKHCRWTKHAQFIPHHSFQSLDLDVRPNLMGVSMGGFITLNSAAFYGDAYDNFVMLVTSAGSPNSPPPTDQAQEVLVGSNSTPLQSLNTSFPLRYPQGACM